MEITITPERPDSADALDLIGELSALLEADYPPASRHGLGVEQLLAQQVAFFVLRADGAPAGCGGVKFFGDAYGELKRMYVRPQYQGRGLGAALVEHLAAYARERGVPLLRLETGVYQEAAIRLYERMGFRAIAPFGDYRATPLNRFYELSLEG
jgi:GNAT superfamily N-acetyltransferase